MSNVTRATLVINETYADEYVKMHMTPPKVAAALDDAGCLAPTPQIIRTVEELEALDPDTLVLDSAGYTVRYGSNLSKWDLPLALIREGAEVRACREALEGGAE
ncbi:hypothetical protein [Corynebacterium sp. AOP40-4SA-5]|uniref:hypothetical protein n=1 Tax=Corynebacterium sp. AOP40-4SA-5 TaxID=3457678 RepID=UPI00403334B6